ncbi:MAG: TRAP transporter large permease [Enterocloster clostridioformis]
MSTGVMIMTVTLLVLLFLKLPVFVAILGASAVYFVLTPGINPAVFAQQAITGAESVTLLAIPFFVCAGVLMNYTGVTKRIMDFCAVLTGRMYGGLSQVNILLSTLMGGLSGSALADAAMEAKMLVPEMEKKGLAGLFDGGDGRFQYDHPADPPGIGLILYGCIANVSIGKLFVAGFGPGVLLCATMMFMVSRISKKRAICRCARRRCTLHVLEVLPACGAAAVSADHHYRRRAPGVFTATEAGSVAIVYAAILGIVYRELGFKEIAQGLKETLQTTSSIMLIVAAASTFSWILTKEMIPQRFTEWMIQMINNKWIFLVAVDIFLIFVGMFVEGNASMIVLVPLFAPPRPRPTASIPSISPWCSSSPTPSGPLRRPWAL